MGVVWRARAAIASAAKGWACVWLLLLVLSTVSLLRTGSHVPFTDLLSVLLLWVVSTGIVTLGTTALLVTPYVCVRSVDSLLREPWRIYFESGVIAILASLVLTYFVKPQAETFWRSLVPYLTFALVTSLTSSVFYMRRLMEMSRRGVVTEAE